MNILLDAKLPRHWVSRIEACAQMAAASGLRYGVVLADPDIDLVEQGLRHWPAVVVQALSARASNGVPDPSGANSSRVPIVGYVRQADVALVARALHGGWALNGVLIEDVSDKPWDVLEALQSAQRSALPAQLEQNLVEIGGERIGRLSMQALLDGRRITVALLSEHYGKSQRTLRRDFARRGLPRPERWAGWLTTLAASAYLCASQRTIDSVGFALGYDSGAAVSQACRRLTGSGLSAFRGPRGYESVLQHLRVECAGQRARKALPSGE